MTILDRCKRSYDDKAILEITIYLVALEGGTTNKMQLSTNRHLDDE